MLPAVQHLRYDARQQVKRTPSWLFYLMFAVSSFRMSSGWPALAQKPSRALAHFALKSHQPHAFSGLAFYHLFLGRSAEVFECHASELGTSELLNAARDG
jgi:hypothetical protein